MSKRLGLTGLIAGCVALAALQAQGAGAEPSPPGYGTSLGVPPPTMAMPPPAPKISIARNPVLGAADAPVTIVEFSDYQCPYCQEFAKTTFLQLKVGYIDTGKVRYVSRDFPLAKHERARPAAIVAACAGQQGKYWEMHGALLAAAGQLTEADFERHARMLKLDKRKFAKCRAGDWHDTRLDEEFADGRAVGVSGTPSFLVGASRGDVAEGRLLRGGPSYADFEKVLARYLDPQVKPDAQPAPGPRP